VCLSRHLRWALDRHGRSVRQSISGDLHREGRLDDVIVRTGKQILSLVTVGDTDDVLFIGVLADRMVNLGQLLVRSKQAAEAIKALL